MGNSHIHYSHLLGGGNSNTSEKMAAIVVLYVSESDSHGYRRVLHIRTESLPYLKPVVVGGVQQVAVEEKEKACLSPIRYDVQGG